MIINFLKKSVLSGIMLLMTSALFAQPLFSGKSEFRKFSIGLNVGALRPSVIAGGANDFTKPLYSLGYGANLKYQFSHYFAIQADVIRGKLKGNNDKDYGNGAPANRPNSDFETELQYAASLSGVMTFGNVNWLNKKNTIVPYFTAGAGLVSYKPSVEGEAYNSGDEITEFYFPVGVGLKFRLSDLINLDLGYRAHFVDQDNLDGTRDVFGEAHKDKFSYGFLGIEFALGGKDKKQLMFDNPAARLSNILQTQITSVQTQVDSIKAQLSTDDDDGDGVFNQYDREPNTAAGSPVDFQGVSKDTDGDGVPDYRDKQLITPTECQPVDADGIGKCPDPECCKNMVSAVGGCIPGSLPSISFNGNSRSLSNDAKAMLATVASKLKNSAECTITVTGYPVATKASQALCNGRVEAIKSYLVENEGISGDRIMTNCDPSGGGDSNVVDIKSN